MSISLSRQMYSLFDNFGSPHVQFLDQRLQPDESSALPMYSFLTSICTLMNGGYFHGPGSGTDEQGNLLS